MFAVGEKLLKAIRETAVTDFEMKSKNKGRRGLFVNEIKDQLKKFPRQASHYSPYDEAAGKERILAEDLNYSKCWKLFCKEIDPGFTKQAEEIGYWRSMDRKSQCPAGVIALKPKACHFHLLSMHVRYLIHHVCLTWSRIAKAPPAMCLTDRPPAMCLTDRPLLRSATAPFCDLPAGPLRCADRPPAAMCR